LVSRPSPRHNDHDQHSGLTEIHLHFEIDTDTNAYDIAEQVPAQQSKGS
jgi:hypothetical protein